MFSTETNRILYTLPGSTPSYETLTNCEGTSKTVRSLSFSPGSNYLAAAGDSKVISIYDVQHGEQIANLSGHSSPILSVDWNRTGQLLLSRYNPHAVTKSNQVRWMAASRSGISSKEPLPLHKLSQIVQYGVQNGKGVRMDS